MGALALIAEALSLVKPGITLGLELYETLQRGKEIASGERPDNQAELDAFKVLIDEQRARLQANTVEIEKDD